MIKAILNLNHNYSFATPQNITNYPQNQICLNGANDDDISQRSNTIHQNHNVNTKTKWQTKKKCGFIHVRHEIRHHLPSTQMHPHNIMGNHPFPTIGTTKKSESP
jgi:hypothetical protein